MNTLNFLRDFLNSEEGEKSIRDYAIKLKKEEEIETSQLERLHSKIKSYEDFDKIINAVRAKYKSKKYQLRHLNKSIEPPETLYFLLFDYAVKYGEECSKKEYKKYAGAFTSAMFKIHGYYLELISGQGSFVHIFKPANL